MTASSVFTPEWLRAYAEEWNEDTSFVQTLADAGFSARVAYGLPDEAGPRVCLLVENGRAKPGEPGTGDEPEWDLRADDGQWSAWFQEPPGLFALGVAFTNRALHFRSGDYPSMIKNPPIAGSFVHSFILMSRAFERVNKNCGTVGEKPA